ncbi:MAG: DUF4097 family beta strand repeat-containing protein [Oscillospiraceae bacterium]
MKALIRIFLPLCIFSFIAFGISTAVLGVNPDYAHSELSATSGETSTTTLEGEYDRIKVEAGASKVVIKPHSEGYTRVTVDGQNITRVNAKISGGELKIYNEWQNPGNWINRLFDGSLFYTPAAKVTVLVPDKVYEELKLYCGAGDVECSGVRSIKTKLDASAGEVRYTQPDMYTESIEIDVSAGSLKAYNVHTEKYDIDVSAGGAVVYGLTGEGDVNVSAGSATVYFDELNGDCDVDVSAGEAILYIPEDASADIKCSRSAGDIKINACGVNKTASDNENIKLNGGEYEIDASVSAGSIKIANNKSEDNAVTTMTGVAYVEPVESVGDVVGSAVEQAIAEVSISNY